MVLPWDESARERPYAGTPQNVRAHAAMWLPDPQGRRAPRADRAQAVIQFTLALMTFGMVIPSDLILANWFFGAPIPALRDPMVINAFVSLAVALAIPVIPLTLLAILLHFLDTAIGRRQRTAG